MTPKEKRVARNFRRSAGSCLTGGSRAMESCVGFSADTGLINRKYLTKREKKILDKAQGQLAEGVRLLRVLGNHLENPKDES